MGKPREQLREVDRAIIQAVMFQRGIVPMEHVDLDMRRPLLEISPEEARVLKRKFRKLWRKAMRALPMGNARNARARSENLKKHLGVGKHIPSRAEKIARKKLVFDTMWAQTIEPLIKRFEASGKDLSKGSAAKIA